MPKPKRILIIALSGIGDALMFSPALRLLRQAHPDAVIDLLCMFKGVEDIYLNNTDINSIHRWDFLRSSLLASIRFVFSLRGLYDTSISVYPANRWEYNIINYLIGAPKRLGHEYLHLNKMSLYFLNTDRILENDSRHNVEENVKLTEKLGLSASKELPNLQVNLTSEENRNADEWLLKNGLDRSPVLIGLHAGSAELKNHSRRRWAPEKYAALALRLIEKKEAAILLFGGPDELKLNEHINSMIDNRGHIVQTPFMTTAALMKRCSIFICNDTGLMHVAAGIRVPTVTIFAYTNPAYVYPWKNQHSIIRHPMECSPCFYYSPRPAKCKWKEDAFRCITHIDIDEVWQAAENILSEKLS